MINIKNNSHKDVVNEIFLSRGRAITKFASMEKIIATFIAIHYLKSGYKKFLEEFLEHDLLSFDFKKRILYLIIKKYYPQFEFPNEELEDLQKLRNLIAHSSLIFIKNQGWFFVHKGRDNDVKDTFLRWDNLIDTIGPKITNLPNIKVKKITY